MQNAKRGDKVKVRYTGKFQSGKVFDKTNSCMPLIFEIGGGMVVPEFENAVMGMQVGEKKTVTIPADKAIGHRREDLVIDIKRSEFPGNIEMFHGKLIDVQMPGGQKLSTKIASFGEEWVRVDANHLFIGETLIFDIELLEII
ncbi:MAG: FKBP-type peptidyl-prolyl cis-trans isomerase [Desulfobacterales bacterium]|jgi:peptidylprolyl isomerase